MNPDRKINKFYSNTNILITGASGFVGKVLIQKLLRTYEDIACLYLIIRRRKNKSPQERIQEIFENPVFNKLRELRPNFEKKICVLEGDTSLLNFGLNEIDKWTLIDKIDIVFHCAANLNMGAELKDSVHTNVRGLCELLDLCKEMKNLKSFVFVSTAYANTSNDVIEEKFYETNVRFDTLLKMVNEMNDLTVKKITPSLINNHANTYTYSKHIAEEALRIKGADLPICLFRPSIVTCASSDPLPGWTDNVYGPLGLGLAYRLGILRVFYVDKKKKADVVPVDYCVNALICSAWDAQRKRTENPKKVPVYNYSSNEKFTVTLHEMLTNSDNEEYQSELAFWKRIYILTTHKQIFYILNFLLHTIPAFIIDGVLFVLGRKRRAMKIYAKLSKLSVVLSYFSLREWFIENDNVYEMWEKLSEEEKALHPFHMGTVNFNKYFKSNLLGAKLYILKENLDNIDAAKRRYRRLEFQHYTLVATILMFWIWVAYKLMMYLMGV